MTKVFIDEDKDRYLIEVTDHCPDSKVCAAISCLLYSLEGWLANEEIRDNTLEIEKASITEGYALIAFSGGVNSAAIFDFVRIGFAQLEASYPSVMKVQY